MKKMFEMQGPDNIPEDTEDVIYVRNEAGELVQLEVADDSDEKDGEK